MVNFVKRVAFENEMEQHALRPAEKRVARELGIVRKMNL